VLAGKIEQINSKNIDFIISWRPSPEMYQMVGCSWYIYNINDNNLCTIILL